MGRIRQSLVSLFKRDKTKHITTPTVHNQIVLSAPSTPRYPSASSETSKDLPTSTAPILTALASPNEETPAELDGQAKLWNEAYDRLKTDKPKLVDAYEKLLSRKFGERNIDSQNESSQENEINQTDPRARQAQMVKLVTAGLKKTEKGAAVKQKVQGAMQFADPIKDLVGEALQFVPQAAIPWAGVCLFLEVLSNPINEAVSNREGMSYVVSRIEWYCNLWSLLESDHHDKSKGLEGQLRNSVINLFINLLSYQMESVSLYYRNQFAVIFRDVVKLDDWEGTLASIKDTESAIEKDIRTFNNSKVASRLGDLVVNAESMRSNLSRVIQSQTETQEQISQKEKNEQCLKDLRVTDPSDDKTRIENTKGGLHRDSSSWILEHEDFQRWRDDAEARILWIKGGPGKGKTMLLITIIDELERLVRETSPSSAVLSYFFCQGTNSNLNNAQCVLRGLVYRLGAQKPSLVSHLRAKYDTSGASVFKDENSFFAISKALKDMLGDADLSRAYIVIDALDECDKDLPELLRLIIDYSSALPHVKWVISSRNRSDISQQLQLDNSGTKLNLELKQNTEQISRAVNAYIDFKIRNIASLQEDDELKTRARDVMRQKAAGTFLWVALVVQQLERINTWDVMETLQEMPPDLNGIYDKIMGQINQYNNRDPYFCQQVLSTATLAYRPLHLTEMAVLSGLPQGISTNLKYVEKIVTMCGSFLNIRENYVTLIHQSAKDYFSNRKDNLINSHHDMFTRSIEAMESLQRNIYNLKHFGVLISEIEAPIPDPLAAMRYSCVYWIDHFCDHYGDPQGRTDSCDGGRALYFLQEKSIYWFEALCLIQEVDHVIIAIMRLEALVKAQPFDRKLIDMAYDSRRFILHNAWVMKNAPLQIYTSALMFSPVNSLIRQRFHDQSPQWIMAMPKVDGSWSPFLQTFESSTSDFVGSLAFSHDSKLLASCLENGTVRVWNTTTGSVERTFIGPRLYSWSTWDELDSTVVFSHDSKILVSSTSYSFITSIWDMETGSLKQTIEETARIARFSHDSKLLALSLRHGTINIFNTETWSLRNTFESRAGGISSMSFSRDSNLLASASQSGINIWNTETRSLQQTLDIYVYTAYSVAFSQNLRFLALGSGDATAKIWDMETGHLQQTFECQDIVTSVALSHDSKLLISCSKNQVRIWDVETGELQGISESRGMADEVAFSHDSRLLALRSRNTVNILDVTAVKSFQQMPDKVHTSQIKRVVISHDSKLSVSMSSDSTKIWDATTGSLIHTLPGWADEYHMFGSIAFSHDLKLLFMPNTWDAKLDVWNLVTGSLQMTLNTKILPRGSRLITSSRNSQHLAVASKNVVRIWDLKTGLLEKAPADLDCWVNVMSFNDNGSYLDTEAGRIETATGALDRTKAMTSPRTSESSEDRVEGHCRYDLDIMRTWITWNGKNLIWIPPDYRVNWISPDEYAISSLTSPRTLPAVTTIALGSKLGRVVIIGLSSSGPSPL